MGIRVDKKPSKDAIARRNMEERRIARNQWDKDEEEKTRRHRAYIKANKK